MFLWQRNVSSRCSSINLIYCLLVIVFKLVYIIDQLDSSKSEIEQEDDKLSKRSLQTPSIPIQRYASNGQLPPTLQKLHFTNPQQQTNWNFQQTFQTNSPPANFPAAQPEELDRFWFLKNFAKDTTDQYRQQLAAINNRAPLNQPATSSSGVINGQTLPKVRLNQSNQNEASQESQVRSDGGPPRRFDENPLAAKRGRLDDLNLLNYDDSKLKFASNKPSATKSAHFFPAQQQQYPPLFKKSNLLLDKLETNCIKRSESKVAICEDHLIRRLKQDAGEGRTAFDVERRVCCALFWHKDCVARMMLETCPDSSPAAADELMGPRKLDLTLSCQKFNRDGCNTANQLLSPTILFLTVFIIISLSPIVHLFDQS